VGRIARLDSAPHLTLLQAAACLSPDGVTGLAPVVNAAKGKFRDLRKDKPRPVTEAHDPEKWEPDFLATNAKRLRTPGIV